MNVNSDLFTKELAIAIQADTVIYLSDIEGVKINGFIQSHLTGTDIKTGFDNKQITDGMIPKLESCLDLLKAGINKVWIGNDLSAFNDSLETKLKGTWIVNSEAVEI